MSKREITPGLWLARGRGYGWNNLVVLVSGEPPFLRCLAWDIADQRVHKIVLLDPEDDIEKWVRQIHGLEEK